MVITEDCVDSDIEKNVITINTKVAIGMPAEGITLNDPVFLHNEDSTELKLFDTKQDAVNYLKSHGYTYDDDMSLIRFYRYFKCPICKNEYIGDYPKEVNIIVSNMKSQEHLHITNLEKGDI